MPFSHVRGAAPARMPALFLAAWSPGGNTYADRGAVRCLAPGLPATYLARACHLLCYAVPSCLLPSCLSRACSACFRCRATAPAVSCRACALLACLSRCNTCRLFLAARIGAALSFVLYQFTGPMRHLLAAHGDSGILLFLLFSIPSGLNASRRILTHAGATGWRRGRASRANQACALADKYQQRHRQSA